MSKIKKTLFSNKPVNLNKESLIKKGFISAKTASLVKVLANGDITKKLTIEVDKISESAKAKVEKAGGTVTVVKSAEKAE